MLQLAPETEQLARRVAERVGRRPDDQYSVIDGVLHRHRKIPQRFVE